MGKLRLTTHGGAPAKKITPLQQLKRIVMACFLWEDSFYVDGEEIAKTLVDAVNKVTPEQARDVAIEARTIGHIRHAPLLIARAMAKSKTHRKEVARTLAGIIQRPDELTEFLFLYMNK